MTDPDRGIHARRPSPKFKLVKLSTGVFTIYVDKMRGVGGLPNVNEMSTEGVGGPSNVNVDRNER